MRLDDLINEVNNGDKLLFSVADEVADRLMAQHGTLTDVEAAVLDALRQVLTFDGRTKTWGFYPLLAPAQELTFSGEDLDLIEATIPRLKDPRVSAHLNDFLWVRGDAQNRFRFVKSALESYEVVIKEPTISNTIRYWAARRAIGLAIGVSARETEVDQAALSLIRHLISESDLTGIDKLLSDYAKIGERDVTLELIRLIEAARIEPQMAYELAKVKNRLRPDLGYSNYDFALETFEQWADSAPSMVKHDLLSQAFAIASDIGHPDRDRLVQKCQSVDVFEDMEPMRHSTPISHSDVHDVIQWVIGDEHNIECAISRLVCLFVGLFVEPNDRTDETGLLGVLPSKLIGAFGSTQRAAIDGRAAVHRQAVAHITNAFFMPALLATLKLFSPTPTELRELVRGVYVDDDSELSMVDGLGLLADWNFHASACVLTPAVEAVLRSIAHSHGLVVINPPRGDSRGGVKTFGELLHRMMSAETLKDMEQLRAIDRVFQDDVLGFNLRNNLLHGLHRAAPWQAALVAVAALSLIQIDRS